MSSSAPLFAASGAMRVLLALLLAAAVALQLSAAQPVTTTVSDDAAESAAKAIQLAIAEQDGHTAAQLIAQAFATKEKPSLGVVITPQQRSTTPKVLPDNTKIIFGSKSQHFFGCFKSAA